MKKLHLIVPVLAAVFLAAAVPASAQAGPEKATGPYLIFQGGAYTPANETLYDLGVSPKWGVDGNVVFGMKFLPWLALQADTGYMQTTGDNNFKFYAIPLTAAVRLSLPIAFVEPYILGGGGAYFSKVKAETDGGTVLLDESDTKFAAYLGGGVNFNIGKFIIGAEGRYLFLDNAANLDGIILFANLGFSF